ncbi:uncharacterized protein LOC141701697 [Apium graveolens]|uniref:uncharacterized protein LOC141701697 n=1 Tax=Apium graveolens TaxID=4045 RepID=UPI003D791C4F
MSCSTVEIEHFSHPEHPLVLKEDVVIGADATCSVCDGSVIGSPTYTCSSSDDINCQNFYLHKTCAELPKQIIHPGHKKHTLTLLPAPRWICDTCLHDLKFGYICDHCGFAVCVICAYEQRVLTHPGHEEHTLQLIQRESLFTCDACSVEAKDASYVCTTCQFWIHKSCATSPFIIPDPPYHHHPLHLVYSIPDEHRYFPRECNICSKFVQINFWMYYCHKCTYFVHMKCATSSDIMSLANESEADDLDKYPDLVQFPLPSEESLFELITTQCCKLQVNFQGEDESNLPLSTIPDDPDIIEEHWSHKNHPLEQLQFTMSVNDDDDDDDDDNNDSRVLICDGCIEPITASCPSYYACIKCQFFLHAFCATKLPEKLPIGACGFHPQHSLVLKHMYMFYNFWICRVCDYFGNGFYYKCEACDIRIHIRCAFLPTRIRYKSHKHHSLVQRPFSGSRCSVTNFNISLGVEYACETCSTFQIHIISAFYPSRMKHKYDDHPITLRYPPFFYEGVIYCEICEDQVNNQLWLYHCDECDHPFLHDCLRSYINVKCGGKIEHKIRNQPHTLTMILKKRTNRNRPLYSCDICKQGSELQFYFECDGCGFLACIFCIRIQYMAGKEFEISSH